MSPDLRSLIYATIAGVISAILIYGGKLLFDKIAGRKNATVDRGQKITELADAMVDVSTKAVEGIRGELARAIAETAEARAETVRARAETAEARAELASARDELRATRRTMEEREVAHETDMGRLRRRIAQLVKVLTDNNLEVPDEIPPWPSPVREVAQT